MIGIRVLEKLNSIDMRKIIFFIMMCFLFICVSGQDAPLEKAERRVITLKADKEALDKFVQICGMNEKQPAEFIRIIYVFGFDYWEEYTGFYSLYLNPEKGEYVMSGDDLFFKMTTDFIGALSRHKDVDIKIFNMLTKPDFSKIDSELWKMGIKLNIDR